MLHYILLCSAVFAASDKKINIFKSIKSISKASDSFGETALIASINTNIQNPVYQDILKANKDILLKALQEYAKNPSSLSNWKDIKLNLVFNVKEGMDTESFIKLLITLPTLTKTPDKIDFENMTDVRKYLFEVSLQNSLSSLNLLSLNKNLLLSDGQLDDSKVKIINTNNKGAFTSELLLVQVLPSALNGIASKDSALTGASDKEAFKTFLIYKGVPKKSAPLELEALSIVKNDPRIQKYNSLAPGKLRLSFSETSGVAPNGNSFVLLHAALGKGMAEMFYDSFKDVGVFEEFGKQLANFHQEFSILNNEDFGKKLGISAGIHGDLHPNNVFYDEKSKRFTLIDMATMALALNKEFYEKTNNGQNMHQGWNKGETLGNSFGIHIMQDIMNFIQYPSTSWYKGDFKKQCSIEQLIQKIQSFLHGYIEAYANKKGMAQIIFDDLNGYLPMFLNPAVKKPVLDYLQKTYGVSPAGTDTDKVDPATLLPSDVSGDAPSSASGDASSGEATVKNKTSLRDIVKTKIIQR